MANMANSAAYKIRTGPFAGRMGVDVDSDKTLGIADSGYVQNVIASGKVISVPATATQGIWPIVSAGNRTTNGPAGSVTGNKQQLINISPVAADQIQGGPTGTAVDNKDLILVAATGNIGDYVVIHNTGEANGPVVASWSGVWTREA